MPITKKYLSFLLILLPIFGFAQDLTECQKIVELTYESLNSKSTNGIDSHLSQDFSIAGQKQPVASIVLQQLIAQLNDPVVSYEQKEIIRTDDGLRLVYDFTYEKKGKKETVFMFDAKNQLVLLELFKMEVKQMCKEDTKVTISDKEVIKIPFQMRGKLILVDVVLNGIQRKFLLDSGSPKTILNSNYLQGKEDSLTKISSVKGVNGSVTGLDMDRVKELNFQGNKMIDQKILTLDLNALEEEGGEKIYGLIGYDLLKDFDLLFDYDKLELTLIKPNYFKQYEKENLLSQNCSIVPLKLEGHIPIIQTEIMEGDYSFGIDCGAEINLIDEAMYPEFSENLIDVNMDTLSGAEGTHKEVIMGKVPLTQIGENVFREMATVFSDISHINEGYSIEVDGIIGYEFLCKQPTLISYARKELRLYF